MHFEYSSQELHVEGVPLTTIADKFGSPSYVYSKAKIVENFQAYRAAFGERRHSICYAVKANSNLAILNLLHSLGAGFDVVSVGELERVRVAGGNLSKTVFAGVGKTNVEISAAIEADIECFNIESLEELERINHLSVSLGRRAKIAVRVNPDVDPKTHPYISTGLNENKFGIPMSDALDVYRRANTLPGIEITGVACHIGSQLTEISPFIDAAERVNLLLSDLQQAGIELEHVDIGGGLGIAYDEQTPPAIGTYISALCNVIDPRYRLVIEPGRSIVGDAGLLLARVLYLKSTPKKLFAIVDASMTELIRPALYQANHRIQEVRLSENSPTERVDVVGPVCETADFLGKDLDLKLTVGDLLVIRDAGAYGSVMSSNYNSRPRPAEVMVDGHEVHLIRERDTLESLYANEHIV